MRILFTRFPFESAFGGAEVQTLSLMEGLMDRGHSVAFAGSCPVLLGECRKRNISAAEVHIGSPPVTAWGAVSFAWRKRRMRTALAAMLNQFQQLDVIAMLSLSEKLLLTDITARQGMRTVWIEHDRVGRWLKKNPWKPLLLRQSNRATTITVSELSRKIYLDLGWDKERVMAIPNGIGERRAMSEERRARNSKIHVGCIARLSSEKGIDILLEAIATTQGVTLEIVGEGREKEGLQALIGKLHLEDRVRLTGREDDLAAVYGRIDALILPSRDHDPFGLVAAEAMMAGVAVIVTDACGIAAYLHHDRDAIIVTADCVSALSKAISHVQDPAIRLRISRRGQQAARKNFSLKNMVDRYEAVFTG